VLEHEPAGALPASICNYMLGWHPEQSDKLRALAKFASTKGLALVAANAGMRMKLQGATES
jgi:hypothetical protein